MSKQRITSNVLSWYRRHGRNLPWRQTTSPYHVLVSEIMLHQTQVDRVKGYYHAWIERFPDWTSLAKASNADVIRAWSGLGYNRRALMLRDAARFIEKEGVPTTREEWQEIKGIGPYTSAAVALFSANERVFPVDTNTRRVVGRAFLAELFPTNVLDDVIEKIGEEQLMQTNDRADVVQALFDLASSICKKDPDCEHCPIKDMCLSSDQFLSGTVTPPKRTVKKVNERIHRNKKYPDRIYRGRIVQSVQGGPVRLTDIGKRIDATFDVAKDQKWLHSMLKRLEKDGMITIELDSIRLSDHS